MNKADKYREIYKPGTVIRLTAPINDKYTPKPVGARFKVDFVDDECQLHGSWLYPECGSMAVIIEEDSFVVEE